MIGLLAILPPRAGFPFGELEAVPGRLDSLPNSSRLDKDDQSDDDDDGYDNDQQPREFLLLRLRGSVPSS